MRQALDTSSSEKSQVRMDDDLFNGFEYSLNSIAILQREINEA